MRQIFIKRANSKGLVAYILLTIAISVIIGGIFLAISLSAKFSLDLARYSLVTVPKEKEEIFKLAIDNVKYKYITFLITLLSMLFFISQTLLRLYRYNILKADFYIACADSLILTQKFSLDKKKAFQTLLTTIIAEKISLTTPKPPSMLSVFPWKEK